MVPATRAIKASEGYESGMGIRVRARWESAQGAPCKVNTSRFRTHISVLADGWPLKSSGRPTRMTPPLRHSRSPQITKGRRQVSRKKEQKSWAKKRARLAMADLIRFSRRRWRHRRNSRAATARSSHWRCRKVRFYRILYKSCIYGINCIVN